MRISSKRIRPGSAFRKISILSIVFFCLASQFVFSHGGQERESGGAEHAGKHEQSDEPPSTEGGEEYKDVHSFGRENERERMVKTQIEARDVDNEKVLEAMRNVPRHLFVPEENRGAAYRDTPLPIGHGQTISQPYIVAYMTEMLAIEAGEKVLEIGTGSGYQAAVLAEITKAVYTIEIIEPLAEQARERFEELGYDSIRVKTGDGYYGWEEYGPFDAIIVTAAAGHVPSPLVRQLKPGGTIVIPVGGVYQVQTLMLITKKEDGSVQTEQLMPVRFVPMTGQVQEE